MTLVKVNNPMTKTFEGFFNELLHELPTNFGKTVREDVFNYPPVNIIEENDSYQLEIAAPGYEKADFNIALDNNLLSISAEKKAITNSEKSKIIRNEFGYRAFKRSFTVDTKIDTTAIAAKYENGILKLTLPKKDEVKAGTKSISIL
ncbi:MAG: Hsp20/alpha crystallin family protein [Ferruginibacter sp.]